MLHLNLNEKNTVLRYLQAGEEIAIATGYVQDLKSGEYTRTALTCLSDGTHAWTNEDIFNLDRNDIIFDESLIRYILNSN